MPMLAVRLVSLGLLARHFARPSEDRASYSGERVRMNPAAMLLKADVESDMLQTLRIGNGCGIVVSFRCNSASCSSISATRAVSTQLPGVVLRAFFRHIFRSQKP